MITEQQLATLGFKFGRNGAHSARSMMIEELKALLFARDETATKQDYKNDIINFNILHKPTEKSRSLTFRHLVDLYGMSMDIPLFNIFRQWWELSEQAQPILALQLAVARDPILRNSASIILPLQLGEHLPREIVEQHLAHGYWHGSWKKNHCQIRGAILHGIRCIRKEIHKNYSRERLERTGSVSLKKNTGVFL